MLRRLGSIALKLALSGMVIMVFLFLTANAPFFHRDTPILMTTLPPPSGAGMAGLGEGVARLSFVDENTRFEGSFHALGTDSGFELTEEEVPGPCENAGKRHLAATCPDCVVRDAPLGSGQAATLFWSEPGPAGSMGTIFRDCSATLANGLVRVPQLYFNEQDASPASRANDHPASLPIPLLQGSERTSTMTLGNWEITVDAVRDEFTALDNMGRLLSDDGWRELRQDARAGATQNQRVYSRDGAALCVVTLNKADEGFQLVTMMNI